LLHFLFALFALSIVVCCISWVCHSIEW